MSAVEPQRRQTNDACAFVMIRCHSKNYEYEPSFKQTDELNSKDELFSVRPRVDDVSNRCAVIFERLPLLPLLQTAGQAAAGGSRRQQAAGSSSGVPREWGGWRTRRRTGEIVLATVTAVRGTYEWFS